MKKIIVLLLVVFGLTTAYCQEEDRPENTGDNFSLEGALDLFKKSKSLEEFEGYLNEENSSVNNLDLNNDGTIDYITVTDIKDGDAHVVVLSTFLSETEKQDIATIGIEKTGAENAVLQIEGDADLYAANTFVEPSDVKETIDGGKGPDVGVLKTKQLIINVWFWPCIQFIYAPSYVVWHSPWHWHFYPKWFRPWRPFGYSVFYRRCAPHRAFYRRVPTRRVMVAYNVYAPRRSHSTMVVQNRRGAVRPNTRGNNPTRINNGNNRGNNRNPIRINKGNNRGNNKNPARINNGNNRGNNGNNTRGERGGSRSGGGQRGGGGGRR